MNYFNHLIKIPKRITGENYKQYRFFRQSMILVLFGHSLFLLVTLWLGNQKIITLNYIALGIDAIALIFLFKGFINLALISIISYIALFDIFCIAEFGLGNSFSLYYLALIGFIFLTYWRWLFKIMYSVTLILSFIAVEYYVGINGPAFELNSQQTFILNIINILLTSIVISFIVYNYATNAKVAETELRNMHNAKERLFSIIAHDLKGPLGSVNGLAGVLAKRLKDSEADKKTVKYAKNIFKATKETNALLENLLVWAENQKGEIIADIQKIDVCKLIEDSFELHNAQIELKSIETVNKCKLDESCYGDEKMIFTVLRNLISNAIKFCPEGGRIKAYNKMDGTDHIIIIEDSGIGMPNEMIHDLFYPQIKKVRFGTNQESGTGLGLILCKDLIEKNNGKIWIESTPNVGTKVFFTLPSKKNKSLKQK